MAHNDLNFTEAELLANCSDEFKGLNRDKFRPEAAAFYADKLAEAFPTEANNGPGALGPCEPTVRRKRGQGTEANPAPAIRESEAHFESWVVDYAHLKGWKVVGFRPARTNKGWRTPVKYDGEGWPDLVLAREGRLIIAELKSQTGKVTEAQWEWFRLLTRPWNRLDGAYQVYIWRPSDRPEIEKVLA